MRMQSDRYSLAYTRAVIRHAALAVGLVVAALFGVADGAAVQTQNPTLTGTVGPGFTIILRDAQGSRVTNIAPGTYDIEIRDQSVEHNFHLTGPGVNRATVVEDTGNVAWTVTFTEGAYTYFCDPHSTMMRGRLTVGNVVPPPPPSPPPSPPPGPPVVSPKTKLVLASGPGFSITFKTKAGKVVKRMKRGTYNLVVRDRGRIHNAHVIAPGVNRKTSPLTYTGTQTWKVKVAKAGTFRFLCDPHARQGMKGSAKIVS
jgi:plastocyanin